MRTVQFGFDTAENKPCKVCPLSAYRSLYIYPRFLRHRVSQASAIHSLAEDHARKIRPSRVPSPAKAAETFAQDLEGFEQSASAEQDFNYTNMSATDLVMRRRSSAAKFFDFPVTVK